MNKDALNSLYENMRLICYQLPNFLSDLENEYYAKTESDKKIINSIRESLKNCIDNSFDTADLLYTILSDEDELKEDN